MIQNEFKQPNETVSKIEQKTSSRNQSAKCFQCDNPHNLKLCPFIGKEFFFCKNNGHTSKVCRKKAKFLLPIKHSSNVVSETTLVESSEDDLFSIYQLLTSNITPPMTVFITIAGHKLPIEIDTGASISLLNWETFQKINCESNISLLLTKSKLKTYSGDTVSPKANLTLSLLMKVKKLELHF